MATDTARINLELASGRNEVTAPFHQTARRRRNLVQELPIEEDPTELPANARVIVDVPLGNDEAPGALPNDPEGIERSSTARPTWIAFIGGTLAVAVAVWGVMFQRLPDIDPREVIQRNLSDARDAMAEGRYTDPPERSAFHHYSTVLALDPDNTDATAGIDAIADRHLTDARVMLAEQRVAEAAVALDRVRRVRPHHPSLHDLDTQLRAELRRLLAAASTVPQVEPAKVKAAKIPNVPPARPAQRANASAYTTATPPESGLTSRPSATRVARGPALPALPADNAEQTSPMLISPAPADANQSGSTPVVDEPANASAMTSALPVSAPAPVAAVAPKLIKMVEPVYPQEALMRGIEGWVDVSLEVNAAGDVIAPRIEDSSRGRLFNRAALHAVQQWKYEPLTSGDSSERLRVRVQFRHSK